MSLAGSKCADPVALNLWHPVGAVVELSPGTVNETRLLEEPVSYGVSADGGVHAWRSTPHVRPGTTFSSADIAEPLPATNLQVVDDAPFDAQGATRVMSGFAEEGVQLVIGHSFDYGAPIHEMAPDYPDIKFAWQGSCGGFCGVEGPNIADYSMPMHEPAYLSGILAGGITESGVIGANAGYDIPVCRATVEAFLIGVQEVRPDATRLDAFLGSWIDPALGKEATAAQADQGADVFVACGNAGSFGMIQEARERGLSAFGYVYDESSLAPENVVASMAWQIGETYRQMVNDIAADNFQLFYDVLMSDGGFEVQMNPDYSAGTVSAEAMELFDTRLQEVIDGTFEVPFIGSAEG